MAITECQIEVYSTPFGVLVYDDGLEADRLLVRSASVLMQSEYKIGGVVQSNPHPSGRRKCDMHLTDLLSGEAIRISYDLGNAAKGCRLDQAAFAQAGVWVENALAADVDLLIVNKFGKQEAQGRGLRSAIADALLSQVPVLLGVSRHNLDACIAFIGGPFVQFAPNQDHILTWCQEAIRRRRRSQ